MRFMYSPGYRYFQYIDDSSKPTRDAVNAGAGGLARDYDPNWKKPNKQARPPRYKLSPARLRRMGIGR